MNKNNYFLFGIISFIFSFAIFGMIFSFNPKDFGLNSLQSIFSILSSFSILLAVVIYFENKNKNKTALVCEQISFFRKEVLQNFNNFIEDLKKMNGDKNVQLQRIKINEPLEKFQSEFNSQLNLLQRFDTRTKQINLLNALEEFSIRTVNWEITKEKSLNILKDAFIEIVEINAILIILNRKLFPNLYINTLNLYNLWKNDFDSRSIEEKINELKQ